MQNNEENNEEGSGLELGPHHVHGAQVDAAP